LFCAAEKGGALGKRKKEPFSFDLWKRQNNNKKKRAEKTFKAPTNDGAIFDITKKKGGERERLN
jgi:hypothetical protein